MLFFIVYFILSYFIDYLFSFFFFFFFFASGRRHTICALLTGVQTCALPISYSKVMRRALLSPGYSAQARSSSAIGYLRFSGTIWSRMSSRTACRLIARLTPSSSPQRRIIGTTPAVDSVMRRFEIAMPSLSITIFSALATVSKLYKGSPMHIITMLDRSEERRVGKECERTVSLRWTLYHKK